MIIRGPRPESNFLTISNNVIRDTRLSYRARGVLICILSRPDNWSTSAVSLAHEGKEGEKAIYTALTELEECGYVRREKSQDERGRWVTKSYVYDCPSTEPPFPTLGKPTLGNPRLGEPMFGNLPTIRKTDEEELIKKDLLRNTDKPKKKSFDSEFEVFWDLYPRKVGRTVTKTAYVKAMKDSTPEVVLEGLQRASKGWKTTEVQYIPYPSTWLNQGRWMDGEPTVVSPSISTPRQPVLSAELQAERDLKINQTVAFHEGRSWRGVPDLEFQDFLLSQPENLHESLLKGFLSV